MSIEEKKNFAKKIYDESGMENYTLETKRDDEINADLIWIPNSRGPAGLIIGDNEEYLICPSMHDFSYWKEEYKKGKRSQI